MDLVGRSNHGLIVGRVGSRLTKAGMEISMTDAPRQRRGRPSAEDTIQFPVSEHLQKLRNLAPAKGRPFDPPASEIKKAIFEKWVEGTTRNPSKHLFGSYIEFLNKTFPINNASWLAYFLDKSSKIDKYTNNCQAIHKLLDDARTEKKMGVSAEMGNTEFWNSIMREYVGIYQIIRPYTSKNDTYILESMQICEVIKQNKVGFEIHMYSHNQRSRIFLYEGEAYLYGNYIFACIVRLHDSGVGHAIRCLNMFTSNRSKHRCPENLSGLMLRGIKALTMGKAAIAIPFIAIRSDIEYGSKLVIDRADRWINSNSDLNLDLKAELRNAHFAEYSGSEIDGVFIKEPLLIGELNKSVPNLFELCKTIFDKIYRLYPDRRCLYTITPEKLDSILLADANKATKFYDVWKRYVREAFPDQIFDTNPKDPS